MSKYSFIIPAYNAEQTITRCLDSISAQKVDDYEVIVVNDGSTDNTAECVEGYAKTHSNVFLYSKSNGGVSSARNYGIEQARGEYIIFVDADDFISDNYLVWAEQCAGFDWVLFSFHERKDQVVGETYKIDQIEEVRKQTIFSYAEHDASDFSYLSLTSPCSKVFVTHIIRENQLRFNENLAIGEDAFFNLKYLGHVKTMIAINKKVYHYCDNIVSVTRKFNKNYLRTDVAYQHAVYDYIACSPYSDLAVHRLLSAMNGIYHCVGGYFGHKDNHKGIVESSREMKAYLSNSFYFDGFNQYANIVKATFGPKIYMLLLWCKSQRFVFLLSFVMMFLRLLRRVR